MKLYKLSKNQKAIASLNEKIAGAKLGSRQDAHRKAVRDIFDGRTNVYMNKEDLTKAVKEITGDVETFSTSLSNFVSEGPNGQPNISWLEGFNAPVVTRISGCKQGRIRRKTT